MEKAYNPKDIEKKWYQCWEEANHFAPKGEGAPYCIMIPPPNVTGSLHMGHAFQDTLMDTLIRYQRMKGKNTLWQVGTDHAGIATQMVVERQLNQENLTRHDLGREDFIERIWKWKEESGGTITQQLRRMGASVDWSNERFTMDEELSKAVHEVFVQLYDEGLIYRGKRLVNWDPVLHTAISDLEVVSLEESGHLWHIQYPLANGEGALIVATTRPETMLGDAAVAVHPEDERYQHLIGQEVKLPLTGRTLPIIADEYVDPEFGTGCVKITPAHDFNDYEVGQRHNLPLINIFTIDAAINEKMPEAYRGMDRFDARKQIVADLQAQNLLEKTEPHSLKVPRGDRSHSVIEPFLTDQWFVKAEPLAKPAIEAVESGKIRFVPENWSNTYYQWMRNIQDWCISRQLWWGHRIPAWYDADGKVYVARTEEEARNKHQLGSEVTLTQDEDVLDTWFSSALWPFSTLGWPNQTDKLKTFYPTSVLVTGFDIIFFWVARMVMMGLKFTGEVPFHEVYIHGLIRDSEGQKMSKSKGNVLDPIDLIDGIDLESLVTKRTSSLMRPDDAPKIEAHTRKEFAEGIPSFGTDALRFTFCALASTGRDIRFDLNRIGGYRNFCNKLWNAARYALMHCEGQPLLTAKESTSLVDQWILSRWQKCIQDISHNIDKYRFDLAAKAIYEFTWNEFCDWYLELTKPVLQGDDAEQKAATLYTLVSLLENILKAAHPMIPFITEEIWQQVAPKLGHTGFTIMIETFPEANAELINEDAEAEAEWLKAIVMGIRTIRGEMNISPNKSIKVLFKNWQNEDKIRYERQSDFLTRLAKIEKPQWLAKGEEAPDSATALAGQMEILVPMAGLIDKEDELARLTKTIEKLTEELERTQKKLANPNFVDKAPANVVEKEKARHAESQQALAQLQERLETIRGL